MSNTPAGHVNYKGTNFSPMTSNERFQVNNPSSVRHPLDAVQAAVTSIIADNTRDSLERIYARLWYPWRNVIGNIWGAANNPIKTFTDDPFLLIPKAAGLLPIALASNIIGMGGEGLNFLKRFYVNTFQVPVNALSSGTLGQLGKVGRGLNYGLAATTSIPTYVLSGTTSLVGKGLTNLVDNLQYSMSFQSVREKYDASVVANNNRGTSDAGKGAYMHYSGDKPPKLLVNTAPVVATVGTAVAAATLLEKYGMIDPGSFDQFRESIGLAANNNGSSAASHSMAA